MSTQPTVRVAEDDDADRLHELIESSMTSSYALSPQDIETIIEAVFEVETLRDRISAPDTSVVLAEVDGVIAGVVEASYSDSEGEIRWLHVDPERRGLGVGTALFDRIRSEIDDDAAGLQAATLAANTSAGAFLERFGFEQVDERNTNIGGQEIVEYVYSAGDSATSASDESDAETAESEPAPDYPETTTLADGTKVHLGSDPFKGSEGLLVRTFTDAEHSEQHGYYCLHCDSGDVSMGEMEQIRCGDCGNTRKPDDAYDGAYL